MNKIQKQKLLSATILIILVVSICSVLLNVLYISKPKDCQLLNTVPSQELSDLKNVASTDLETLANLGAYVQLSRQVYPQFRDNLFLALNLKEVTFEKDDESEFMLSLTTDCASIRLNLKYTNDRQIIEAEMAQVDLWSQAAQFVDSCVIDSIPIKNHCQTNHYACRVQQNYPCTRFVKGDDGIDRKTTIAYIVIQAIEFEVNGSSWLHEEGEFSLPVELCGDLFTTKLTSIQMKQID